MNGRDESNYCIEIRLARIHGRQWNATGFTAMPFIGLSSWLFPVFDALLLRYGRYCGLLYSGCHDEAPCDGLDSCCKIHENCVGDIGYLKFNCNQNLLNCLNAYNSSGQPEFPGSTCSIGIVISTIFFAIKAGVKIQKHLLEEGLSEEAIQESEQIMMAEFSML